MSFKKLFFIVFLCLEFVKANSIGGININNKDLEVEGAFEINSLADYSSGTTYIVDVNYLNSNGSNMAMLGFSGQNALQGVQGLTLAFGIKSVVASDFVAFPLMAKIAYELPLGVGIPRTILKANFAFAPSVLTFIDGEGYSEGKIGIDMEIISNIFLFAGYRKIDVDDNNEFNDRFNDNDNFNDSFFAGLKLSF